MSARRPALRRTVDQWLSPSSRKNSSRVGKKSSDSMSRPKSLPSWLAMMISAIPLI
jgi:hypothetical protein